MANNFTERREKTDEREKSFHLWPHRTPCRRDMIISGWSLDTTRGNDFTICQYCMLQYNKWESNNDPFHVHRVQSPSCPYILSTDPIHPSSVSIKSFNEIYTRERIAIEVVKSKSNVYLLSNSPYAKLPKRIESFSTFPGGQPPNMEALARAGFYCLDIHTLLQCFYCHGVVNDFHQYSSNEIIAKHYQRFPKCRFAQLLVDQDRTSPTNNTTLCGWCSTESRELAIDPCNHYALCDSCAKLVNTCPICGEKADAFGRLYS